MTSPVEPTPTTSAGFGWVINPRAEHLAMRLAQIFFAAWALFYIVSALNAAFWFDGFPVNGPFQLYDPLRRIAAGQRAGQDFQFFHGIGVPFLHYPLFQLFGGHSLQASELSRQFTSFLLFAATMGAFVWVTFRRPAARWIAATSGILIIELAFRHAAAPGHSFVSGRSAMPIFAFAVLQLRLSGTVKGILVGCCIACAFVFGTEHGISLSLALVTVTGLSVLQALFTKPFDPWTVWGNIKFVAIAFLVAALGSTLFFLAFCGTGGALKAIHYNLVELPADQFWFFGSPPMPYLKDWRQLFLDHHAVLCLLPTYILLASLVGLLLVFRKTPLRLGKEWPTLTALMLTYGAFTAIPLIGILSRHYVFPQLRIFVFVAFVLIANRVAVLPPLQRLWASKGLPRPVLLTSNASFGLTRWLHFAFAAVCGLVALGLVYQTVNAATQLSRHLNEPASYSKYLDAYWNQYMAGMTKAIDANRTRPKLSLWSEYAALLDAHYQTLQPAEDYIIHTVGQERWHHYLNTFRETDPEFVTTMTSQFSFAEWLQDERWEFYEDLLNNYRPLQQIEHATLWQRKPAAWVTPAESFQSLPLGANAQSVVLPVARTADEIVVVRIHYRVSNPWKKLPLLGATPRYLVNVEGTPRNMAVSLPPYVNEFQFPVKLPPGSNVTLRFSTESFLPNALFQVDQVQAKPLPKQPSTDVLFAERIKPSRY